MGAEGHGAEDRGRRRSPRAPIKFLSCVEFKLHSLLVLETGTVGSPQKLHNLKWLAQGVLG